MNDDDREIDPVARQLRAALPPWGDAELRSDLWPRMLRRLEDAPAAFGWWESALAALIVAALAFFPRLLPALLCHL